MKDEKLNSSLFTLHSSFTQDSRLKTQDSRPKTQDSRLKTMFDNGYALIIGTGSDPKIINTANDAEALYQVLTDPNRSAYKPEHVHLLVKEQSTKEGILKAFERLDQQLKATFGATVVIFFAGHGGVYTVDKDGERSDAYYLLPYGFIDNDHTTKISGQHFSELVEGLNYQKLMVMLDCCHAAGMPTGLGDESFHSSNKELIHMLEQGGGKVIVSSSRSDEKSYIFPDSDYSVFGEVLLDALAGKNSKKEYVKLFDVLDHILHEVPNKMKEFPNFPQHPLINKIENLDQNFAICLNPSFEEEKLKYQPKQVLDATLSEVNKKVGSLGQETQTYKQKIQEAGEVKEEYSMVQKLAHSKKELDQLSEKQQRIQQILEWRARIDQARLDAYIQEHEGYLQAINLVQEQISQLTVHMTMEVNALTKIQYEQVKKGKEQELAALETKCKEVEEKIEALG